MPRSASTSTRPVLYALRMPRIEIILDPPPPSWLLVLSGSSLVPQRDGGVHARGPAGRKVSGGHADRAQDDRRAGGDGGREGRTAEELERLALEGEGGDH